MKLLLRERKSFNFCQRYRCPSIFFFKERGNRIDFNFKPGNLLLSADRSAAYILFFFFFFLPCVIISVKRTFFFPCSSHKILIPRPIEHLSYHRVESYQFLYLVHISRYFACTEKTSFNFCITLAAKAMQKPAYKNQTLPRRFRAVRLTRTHFHPFVFISACLLQSTNYLTGRANAKFPYTWNRRTIVDEWFLTDCCCIFFAIFSLDKKQFRTLNIICFKK